MKFIPLSQQGKNKGKYFAQVDDEDYERISKNKWSVTIANSAFMYAVSVINGKQISMHRFLLNPESKFVFVDHKDGNGLNNQRENIRKCTRSQNTTNKRHVNGESPYLGVVKYHQKYIKKNKEISIYPYWRAIININGKEHRIGVFKTQVSAAKAYDEKAIQIHGEFARLNFPPTLKQ